jgi:hypothetical protein
VLQYFFIFVLNLLVEWLKLLPTAAFPFQPFEGSVEVKKQSRSPGELQGQCYCLLVIGEELLVSEQPEDDGVIEGAQEYTKVSMFQFMAEGLSK